MTQNIEQRTEVAVKKYEGASDTVDRIANTDSTVATPIGPRKSFPKLSREIEHKGDEQRVGIKQASDTQYSEIQLRSDNQSQSIQSRFSVSQNTIEWGAGIDVRDEYQRYHVGIVGDGNYKEFLPNPTRLPFTTGSSIESDLSNQLFLENGVPNVTNVDRRDQARQEAITGRQLKLNSLGPYPEPITSETTLWIDESILVSMVPQPPNPSYIQNIDLSNRVITFTSGKTSNLRDATVKVTSTENLKNISLPIGSIVHTDEFWIGSGYGGWEFNVVKPNTFDDSMPVLKEGVHYHTLANGNQAVIRWNFPIPIEAMGMKNDGSENVIGLEQRLPHAIAVAYVSNGPGKFLHKGNLPTPTRRDYDDFMLRVFKAPIQEYSFTWLGVQSGEILLDLSDTDNNGKKVGFYLSHTDIFSTEYFTPGGPWDSANNTGFQRNITINDVLFKNKAWVYGGDNQSGVPAPSDYENLKHEWWSTGDENSIGICINYSSNVDLKGTIAYGFTANIWLYTWNSSWCNGRARNGRYGYVFPAGTTSSMVTPWASGVDIGYHWGVPDFIGHSESAVGIKPIGYTLISPACDGVSDCAYNILNASSVDLKQPNNEGTANTMIRIGRTVNGNIAIDGINYFGTEKSQEKFPIKSLIEYRSEANFCSLTVRNFKGYLGSLFPAKGVMFNVVDAAKSNFLSTTKLVNVRRDVGVTVSNISDQEMAKIYTENNIDYLRIPSIDYTNSFTVKQSDLLDIVSRYGTFAESSNFFTLAYEYSEANFQRFAVVTHFVLQRRGASYENITVLEDTLTAKFINGTGGGAADKQISIDVSYSDGTFTFTMSGQPIPRRHSAVISYLQSA
ncbi:hypothetical protein ACN5WT_004671 [Vibrio parahaemolyticus]